MVSNMLFYLFLLLLFSFQQVTALPLLARAEQHDQRPGVRPAQLPTTQPLQPPTVPPSQLPTSQTTTAQSTTITSIQIIDSPTGVVTETCVIILIPQGSEVQEVKNCTLSTTPTVSSSSVTTGNSSAVPPDASTSIPTVPALTSSSSVGTSSSPVPTFPLSVPTSSSSMPTSLAPAPTSPLSVPTSSSSVQTPPAPVPTSLDVPASSSSIPTSSSSVSTSLSSVLTSTSSVSTSVASSIRVKGTSSVPASTVPILATFTGSISGTAAAEQGATDATISTMPGRKLSVLPIGLGVFAGISVIALVVVGLVTYERTKYRKAFRQRKLAELGAEMGYGGDAL